MSKVYNYKSKIKTQKLDEGESIEQKMRRVLNSGEKIEDTAPEIYTERKDGVLPQYDIRTDRFDIALEAMDKVNRSQIAQRDAAIKTAEEPKHEPNKTE